MLNNEKTIDFDYFDDLQLSLSCRSWCLRSLQQTYVVVTWLLCPVRPPIFWTAPRVSRTRLRFYFNKKEIFYQYTIDSKYASDYTFTKTKGRPPTTYVLQTKHAKTYQSGYYGCVEREGLGANLTSSVLTVIGQWWLNISSIIVLNLFIQHIYFIWTKEYAWRNYNNTVYGKTVHDRYGWHPWNDACLAFQMFTRTEEC